MKLKDLWTLSRGMSFKSRIGFVIHALKIGVKVYFKLKKKDIMEAFKKLKNKGGRPSKFVYGMPEEEGYYWFSYISEHGEEVPREPCHVYKDDEGFDNMLVAFVGSEDVLTKSDLEDNHPKDAMGNVTYRFQKIIQQGENLKPKESK